MRLPHWRLIGENVGILPKKGVFKITRLNEINGKCKSLCNFNFLESLKQPSWLYPRLTLDIPKCFLILMIQVRYSHRLDLPYASKNTLVFASSFSLWFQHSCEPPVHQYMPCARDRICNRPRVTIRPTCVSGVWMVTGSHGLLACSSPCVRLAIKKAEARLSEPYTGSTALPWSSKVSVV